MYIYVHTYIYVYVHGAGAGADAAANAARPEKTPRSLRTSSPPTKSFDFRGFDSSKLLIIRGGNSHVRIIL